MNMQMSPLTIIQGCPLTYLRLKGNIAQFNYVHIEQLYKQKQIQLRVMWTHKLITITL